MLWMLVIDLLEGWILSKMLTHTRRPVPQVRESESLPMEGNYQHMGERRACQSMVDIIAGKMLFLLLKFMNQAVI